MVQLLIWSGEMTEETAYLVKPGERMDDLQRDGLRVLQDPKGFCFGMDAVLLADFVKAMPRHCVCDLGTGTAILPLLTYARYHYDHADAIEIVPDCVDRARRTIKLNKLEDRINVMEGDIRHISDYLPARHYDCVMCNPPYTKQNAALPAKDNVRFYARQDSQCELQDVAEAGVYLLKGKGHLYTVLPAFRYAEWTEILLKNKLQPKRVRFVYAHRYDNARLILTDAMTETKSGCIVMPPLITHHDDGRETDEIKRIYGNS